jgi:hypothetical protein
MKMAAVGGCERSVNRTKDPAMACQKNPYPNQFTALRALEAILAAGKPASSRSAPTPASTAIAGT